MSDPIGVIRIGAFFQGPTDQGQGGWTASKLAACADGPVTIRLLRPIPLETDLAVVRDGVDLWRLCDPRQDDGGAIMEAARWTPAFQDTASVRVEDAAAARRTFVYARRTHPVPHCFSCGLRSGSMGVHVGRLSDGRYGCDWSPPSWAIDRAGVVDPGVIWAALDCAAGCYVSADGAVPLAYTAQYAVEIVRPIEPGAAYAIVAWAGDGPAEWQGRKRQAASAAFDRDGRIFARSTSLWVAPRAA